MGFSFFRYNRYRSSRIRCSDYINKRFDMHLDFYAPENITYDPKTVPAFNFIGTGCTSLKIPKVPTNPVIDKSFNFLKQKTSCGRGIDEPSQDEPWAPKPTTAVAPTGKTITSNGWTPNPEYCKELPNDCQYYFQKTGEPNNKNTKCGAQS